MHNTRRLLALAVAPLSLLLSSPFVGTAHATHVACGAVVVANTTLDSDVGPCHNDGLVVAANNVTINLNGHRLFGDSGPTDVPNVGVLIAGHTGVTVTSSVTGGQIDHFDAGVAIDGSSAAATGNTVSNLTIRDNFPSGPIGGDYGDGVTIFGPDADNNTVSNNSIINNGPYSGVSVFNGSSVNNITGTVIEGNTVTDNRTQSSQTDGIRIESFTSGATVTDNTVTGSALDGIALFRFTGSNTVSGNTVTGNGESGDLSHRPGDGIHVFDISNNNTITNNTVNGNGGNGIVVDNNATGNSVTTNTALNNGTNPVVLVENQPIVYLRVGRIRLALLGGLVTVTLPQDLDAPYFDLKDGSGGCTANTWSGNTYGTKDPACIS